MPRVKEIDTDDEKEAPKLVNIKKEKGKNKRPAEDEVEGLDEMIASDGKKLSKKQQKKLKTEAAAKEAAKETTVKDSPSSKSDKKVQFAKELEQGPTGPAKQQADNKTTTSVKVVQGVTIDDRKVGTGRTVKNGDKVGMRYIGKLDNGKVFDGEFLFPGRGIEKLT
jgi:FK506-binding nuclear protein